MKIRRLLKVFKSPKMLIGYYYRGVDFWPPRNFSQNYRFKFYFIELPLRWIFKGVLPHRWDGKRFNTFFDEHIFIQEFLHANKIEPTFFVDIGAGDGIDMSNTFQLAHAGIPGVAIEGSLIRFSQLSLNYESFPHVKLARSYVDSETIENLLLGVGTPPDFDILNLDIDSYDLHILESILKSFSPKLCVLEWNRSYPPNIYFSVKNDSTIRWNSKTAYFQGASLLAYEMLLTKFNYSIIEVQGAALFAVPKNFAKKHYLSLTADSAWQRYMNGPSEWLATDPEILKLPKKRIISFVNQQLLEFTGKFVIR